MSAWIIGVVTLLYAGTALSYLPERPGMAFTFLGYCVANIGLIWDALTYGKV
jgi:hypothetical protein